MNSTRQRYRRSAAILNKKYSLYMIPALLSAVGVSLSEFADSLIVGRLLNEEAFAIVNLGTPIVFMTSMVYTVTGLGGSLLYAEYLAKKEKERANAYFTASTLLSLAATASRPSPLFSNISKSARRPGPSSTAGTSPSTNRPTRKRP